MPTYEYQCDACGYEFERFQSIKARQIRTCPRCGRRKVRRLLGAGAGIIFRGSGFYQTDYRSESYRKAAEKAEPAPAGEPGNSAEKSAGSADGGGESKDPSPKTDD